MHPSSNVLLETPRLVLRRFRVSDVESFVAYRNDPEIALYQSWESATVPDAKAFIEEQRSRPLFERGRWLQIAVEAKASQAHIGDCAMRITARDPRQAELGFTFSRQHQGRGFATEAVSHLLDYVFSRLDLHRVFAIADDRNLRAIALLERVGMRREGHFREAEWFKGAWVSDVLYAVLASERK